MISGLWSLLEILLHVGEELELLVLLVEDDASVGVVGEVRGPLHVGGAVVGDRAQVDLALDAGDLVGRLGGEHLVTEGVLDVADLVDAELPDGAVEVGDLDDRVELVGAARGELGAGHALGHDVLELERLEDAPGLLDGDGEHGALHLVGRDGDCRADAGEGLVNHVCLINYITMGKIHEELFAIL